MEIKSSTKIFLIPAILFAVFFAFGNEAKAAATNWYVSPTGSANCASGCLTGAPCSLATVLTCNVVGDNNVILKNGTYTGTSLTVPWSGTAGHPITIKAENDGMAIVDGENTRNVVYAHNSHNLVFEGLVLKRQVYKSVDQMKAFQITDSSDITVRRVSVYGMGVQVYRSSNVLIEDFVSAHSADSENTRYLFHSASSDHVTFRRCFALWSIPNSQETNMQRCFILYPSDDSVIENSVCVFDSENGEYGDVFGFSIGAGDWSTHSDRNKIYGNIVHIMGSKILGWPLVGFGLSSNKYNIYGNRFLDNVAIDTGWGGSQKGDSDMMYNRLTVINPSLGGYFFETSDPQSLDPDYRAKGILKNSVFVGYGLGSGINYKWSSAVLGFTNTYNDVYNFQNLYYNDAQKGIGEISVNPNYDTATYGKGAYLMIPSALHGQGENGADIGAEVLYRYQDGALTNEPLWPWPMEDRIKAETGYSVTWEVNGGIWKTLNGVYGGDTTPPAAPSGLTVN